MLSPIPEPSLALDSGTVGNRPIGRFFLGFLCRRGGFRVFNARNVAFEDRQRN
jgi:hypothetical protein